MKVSIIIPVFNTGHLVEKGISSLSNITNVELEIICINDGSTDDSWENLQILKRKYPTIKIQNKKNEGVAITRNNAIHVAKGQYIYFLDSDDWIDAEKFEQLLSLCYGDYDIIHGNFSYVYEDGTMKLNKKQLEGEFSGQDFLCKGLLQDKISMASCINIFKREFLIENDLQFTPGIYQEDEELNLRAFSYASKVISKDCSFYLYLQRYESRSNDVSKEQKRFKDVVTIYQKIIHFLNESAHISESYHEMCSTYVSFMVLLAYAKHKDQSTIKQITSTIKSLKLDQTINSQIPLYKISKLALRWMPVTYIKLLRYYFKKRSKKL